MGKGDNNVNSLKHVTAAKAASSHSAEAAKGAKQMPATKKKSLFDQSNQIASSERKAFSPAKQPQGKSDMRIITLKDADGDIGLTVKDVGLTVSDACAAGNFYSSGYETLQPSGGVRPYRGPSLCIAARKHNVIATRNKLEIDADDTDRLAWMGDLEYSVVICTMDLATGLPLEGIYTATYPDTNKNGTSKPWNVIHSEYTFESAIDFADYLSVSAAVRGGGVKK